MLDEDGGVYKKCFVRDDKLIGAIFVGDKTEFFHYKQLIEEGAELAHLRKTLLRSAASAKPVKGKLVCSCNNVGEGNLDDAFNKGCQNQASLMQETQAGTGCGSCKPALSQFLKSKLLPMAKQQ
ncbi:MAG: hypothetical protein HC896_04645 [Bacteroidales bacterium]|nr:hypothetical protein [Bacteroidales bacterium]